jgi:hypothetical protein
MIAVALAMFYAALFLFAPTTIDAIPFIGVGTSHPLAPGPF